MPGHHIQYGVTVLVHGIEIPPVFHKEPHKALEVPCNHGLVGLDQHVEVGIDAAVVGRNRQKTLYPLVTPFLTNDFRLVWSAHNLSLALLYRQMYSLRAAQYKDLNAGELYKLTMRSFLASIRRCYGRISTGSCPVSILSSHSGFRIAISTRRFFARFSSLSLGTRGLVSARPAATTRSAGI